MNFNKFINSDYLKSNPLCGIGTYKDELTLATGACIRKIKKLVLTGEEDWQLQSINSYGIANFWVFDYLTGINSDRSALCTHFYQTTASIADVTEPCFSISPTSASLYLRTQSTTASDATQFKTWLAQQYSNGTPVTVWYVLATPTTETITVPSGLSGIEEGYLNQSGTPTPTNPIYPTANTVEKWFDINHYIMGTDTDTITTLPAVIYPNAATATVGLKGQMEQNGTPSPIDPIQPSECGDLETEGAKAGQYKIPILSGGVTTPVYLGEVQTTRRIKKLVLDGTDSYFWGHSTTRLWSWYLMPQQLEAATDIPFLCTHGATVTNASDYIYGTVYRDNTLNIGIFPDNLRDENEVRSWLANHAENGTPVIIWYVLATSTTGIVNEPLRKIGDYADEVSGISIPVTAGANTLSVDTTLQPSEVTVNYKGWHPVQSVHERESGQWD